MIKITGSKEIARMLDKLPAELSRKVEMTALRDAMKPTAKAAKRNAEAIKDTGLLAKSIGLNVRKKRKSGPGKGTYSARVGPRSGFKTQVGVYKSGKKKGEPKFQNPTKYAHIVELGSSRTEAKKFIRNALDATQGEILNNLASGYDRGLSNAIRKLK